MGGFGHHQQGEVVVDEAIETFFKFWKDGRPALLNLNTYDGRAWINFSGFLGFCSEPNEKSSSSHNNLRRNKNSPSPSKIKRNRNRAEAYREKKRREAEVNVNNFSEKLNSSSLESFKAVSSSNALADVLDIGRTEKVNNFSEKLNSSSLESFKAVSSSNAIADVSDTGQTEKDNDLPSDQTMDNQNQMKHFGNIQVDKFSENPKSKSLRSFKAVSSSNTVADVSDILISSQAEKDNNQPSDQIMGYQNQTESLPITPVKPFENIQVTESNTKTKEETPSIIPNVYTYILGTTNWDEEFRSKLVEFQRLKEDYEATDEEYLEYKESGFAGFWDRDSYWEKVLNPMFEWFSDLEDRMGEVGASYSSWIEPNMAMLAEEFRTHWRDFRYPP